MEEVKLVDYVSCPSLTELENAHARKAHYESECARISALQLIKQLKGEI